MQPEVTCFWMRNRWAVWKKDRGRRMGKNRWETRAQSPIGAAGVILQSKKRHFYVGKNILMWNKSYNPWHADDESSMSQGEAEAWRLYQWRSWYAFRGVLDEIVVIPCCCHGLGSKVYAGVGRKVGWTLTFIKAVQSRVNPTRSWVITLEFFLMAQEKEHITEPTEEE